MDLIKSIELQLERIGFDQNSVVTNAIAFVLFNSQAYRFNGDRVEITKAHAAEAARWVAKEATARADALQSSVEG